MLVLLAFWQIVQPLQGSTFTWTPTSDGTFDWTSSANWNPSTGIPNGLGHTANLTSELSGAQTINLNRVVTLGALNIRASSGTNAFTLAAGTGGYLILGSNGLGAAINKAGAADDVISSALQFNDNLTITNNGTGLLTLSGIMRSVSSNITFDGTSTAGITVSAATPGIATAGGLVKNGTGLLNLSGPSTYAGTTTINGGTLRVSSTTGLPIRSAVTVSNGAALDLNAAFTIGSLAGAGNVTNVLNTARVLTIGRNDSSTTFTGQILPTTAANIAITKIGAGTLTLAPTLASTYTGNTVINGGGINLDFANTSLTSLLAATPLQITGGNFTMTGKAGLAANQLIGALTVGATGGAITLVAGDASGTTLRTGAVTATASGGTLLITASANTAFQMGTSYAATTLNNRIVFSDGTANTFNWAVNTGANTNTTAFSAYTALPVAGGGLNTTAYLLTASQTQTTAASTIRSLKLSSTGNGTQTLDLATFNMTLGGTATTSPGAILIDGTDAWNINGTTGVLGQATTAGGDLIFHQYNTTNPVTVNAGISNGAGTLNLVKSGPGTLVLAGTNTFTGTIFVNGGVLSFGNVAAAGAGSLGNGSTTAVTIRDGATLRYTGPTGTISGAATTAGAHTYVLQGGNGTIDVSESATVLTLGGAISGAGSLVKSGPGTLVLAVAATHTGSTIINAGTLQNSAADRIPTTPTFINSGATWDIAAGNDTVGTLFGGGTIFAGTTARTLVVGGDNVSSMNTDGSDTVTTFSGMFTGAAAHILTKTGTGILTLAGIGPTSTWTGGTNVNGGILRLASDNRLSTTGTMTIGLAAGSAALELTDNVLQTLAAVTFYGTGATAQSQGNVILGSGSVLTLGGSVTVSATGNAIGAVISGPGTLSVGGATRTISVADSTSVPVDQAELTISVPIASSGAFGITKAGNGNLALLGDNTYTGVTTIGGFGSVTVFGNNTAVTGGTTVNSGRLILDYSLQNNTKIAAGAALTMLGGELILNGNASASTLQTVASTTFAGGGRAVFTLNPGAGQQLVLNLNALTRAAGAGTVRFNLPSGTQNSTNGFTTDTLNTNGLLGSSGFATVTDATGTWFARNLTNAADGNIVAFISTDADDVSAWGTGLHATDFSGFTGTLASTTSINSLRFNADAASTVTIGSGQALGILTGGILQTSNAASGLSSISGGKLTSGSGSELIFTLDSLSQALEISSTITGIDLITKSGNGTLRLTGNNNSSGTVRLHAGTLELTGGNALGDTAAVTFLATGGVPATLSLLAGQTETIGTLSGGSTANASSNVLLGSNAVLTINQTAAGTYSGLFTGGTDTTLIKSGPGVLTYQGNSSTTFTGNLVVNGGGLTLSGNAVGRVGSLNIVLNAGELQIIQDQTSSVDRVVNGATVTLNNTAGTNGLLLNASNNGGRSDTIGTIALGAGQNVITLNGSGGTSAVGTLTVSGATGLTRENNATALVRGRSLGASAVGQRGQLVFTNAPTGALAPVGGGGAAGSTSISILPYLIGHSTAGTPGAADLGNTFVMNTGATNGLRPLVITEGTGAEYIFNQAGFNAMAATSANNVRFNATPSGTLNAAGGGTRTINALAIDSASGAVSVTGPGSDTLALTAGALLSTGALANNTALNGFSGITTATGEYVVFVTNDQFTLGSPLTTSAASLTKASAGALILNGLTNSYANGTFFNQGTIEADTLAALGTGGLNFFGAALRWATGSSFDISARTVNIGLGGAFLNTNGNDVTLANAIGNSGAGSLTKTGAGKLTLNAAATYTGDTFVTEGTLEAGINQAISSGALTVNSGGTFNLAGFNTTLSVLTLAAGSDNILSGTGTLTVNGLAVLNQGSIAPVLAGSMNLIKQTAAQTVTLSNVANTFTGFTHVQNGTLSIAAVANAGTASSLGAATGESAVIRLGNGTTTGTLLVTGAAGSTNRQIDLTGTTGGGVVDNDGSAALILNGDITSSTFGSKTLTLAGATTGFNNVVNSIISNGLGTVGVTKTEAGTWVLAGANSFTGAVAVNGGTLRVTGSVNNGTAASNIGSVADANGFFYLPTGGSYQTSTLGIGNNATGIGSMVIAGGNVTTSSTASGFTVSSTSGYGGLFMSAGSINTFRLDLGANSAVSGTSVAQFSGGTFEWSEYILGRAGRWELTFNGATASRTGVGNTLSLGQATGTGVMSVTAGSVDNSGQTIQFGRVNTGGTTSTSILNINGGVLTTNAFAINSANFAGAFVNFNGGTLRANIDSAAFLPAGLTAAYVNGAFGSFNGGAVFDTNGRNIAVAAALIAPTGNGVSGLTLSSAGTGYTGAPYVEFTGDGTGATGYAVVDLNPDSLTFGQVTGVVLTNPGVGYTSSPTINLIGGGGTGAAVNANGIAANVSGGLTKTGNGTLTLTGVNTFTGATLVNGGTLSIAPGALPNTSLLHVGATGNASFDLFQDGVGAAFVMANNASLTLGSATTLGALGFQLGTSSDTITLSGSGVLTVNGGTGGGGVVNALAISGFGAGSYDLLTSSLPIVGFGNLLLGSLPGGFTYTLSEPTTGTLRLTAAAAASGNIYWTGDVDGSWANFNGGNTNWATNSAGTAEAGYTPASGDTVFFSAANAGAGAISTTLDNAISIAGLKLLNSGTGAVSIAPGVGGTLTVGADGIEIQAGAPALTQISAPVALGAAQTWTVADAGSTLRVSGTLSGDFDLAKAGAGTLVLTANATRSAAAGTSTLSAGTLRLEALQALTTANAIGMSLNGGTLSLARDAAGTFLGVNLTVGGSATIEVDRLNSGDGLTLTVGSLSIGDQTLAIAGGSNAVSGNMQLTTGAATLTGNAIFNVTNNGLGATTTLSIPGITESPASSAFGFTKDGDGILINTGTSNAFTGQVILNAGILRVSGDATSGLGTGAATLTINGGELQLFNSTARNYGRNTTIAGNTTVTLNRNSAGTAVTHTLGTLEIGSQSVLVQAGNNATAGTMGLTFGATTLSGSPTFEVNSNGLGSTTVLTLGALNDGGTARTLTKTGNGVLTLASAAASLINGTTVNINGGRLNSTNTTALGSLASVNVASGAIFGVGASQTVGALSGLGQVVINGGLALTVGGTNNLSSTFGGGTAETTGGLAKAGTGTLTLTGENLHTGSTTVNNGVLLLDFETSSLSANIISSSSPLVLGGGTLGILGDAVAVTSQSFASTTLSANSLSQIQATAGAGGLALNLGPLGRNTGSALNFSLDPAIAVTFSGTSSASGVITSPNGTAFATLGSNDWAALSGTSIVAASYIADDFAPGNNVNVTLSASPVALDVNTLRFNAGAATLTLGGANVIRAGGLLVGSGASVVVLSGTGTLSGSAATGTVAAPVAGEFNIFQHSASQLTISSAIINNPSGLSHLRATPSGTALNKFGPGTLIVSSNRNAYTGGTNIVGGVLRAGAANVIPSGFGLSSATANLLTVSSAATFDLNGFTQTIAGLSGAGLVDSTAAGTFNLVLGDNDGGGTFTGTIRNTAGTVSLVKSGTGTQVLAGQNTYSGSTTVNRGTLTLNFSLANAPLTNILPTTGLVLSTGTLNVTGLTAALAGNSQTFSGTTLAGGGVLTLAGTTSGSLAVNLGTITRNAGSTLNITGLTAFRTVTANNVNNSAGILGGAFIVGGADWAVNDAGNIIALASASYTTLTATGGGTPSATNFLIGSNLTMTGAVTANSLKITGGTLTLGSNAVTLGGAATGGTGGGLLATASATITGTGVLSAGTGNELIVHATSGTLAINTPIGGGALTISGGGTVTLGAANTLNGMITINNATVTMDDATRYGSATGITLNGGTLNWNGAATLGRNLTLGPGGGTINQSNDGSRQIGNATALAFVGTGPRTLTLGTVSNERVQNLPMVIGNADANSPTSIAVTTTSDVRIWRLDGNNTYAGSTTINRGILRLNNANAIGGGLTSSATIGNIVFAGTAANRAILETGTTAGAITRSLGYGPGQIRWEGNGGFSNQNIATQIVNLGGSGAMLTWGAGGFVPDDRFLQFGQNVGNGLSSAGAIDFQNAIDLGAALRQVNVVSQATTENANILGAILSGNLTASAGGGLEKAGTGKLILAGNNAGGPASVTLTAGALIFSNLNAIPGMGANITLSTTAGGNTAIGVIGDTNPLATFAGRIANPETATSGFLLGADSDVAFDFSAFPNMRLAGFAISTLADGLAPSRSVHYTGTITPAGSTYRFGGLLPNTGNGQSNAVAAATALILPASNTLTGANALDLSVGSLSIVAPNNFTGGTTLNPAATGYAALGFGHNAAIGTGGITLVGIGNNAAIGAVNGDQMLANRITFGAGETLSLVLGSNWFEGLPVNAGRGPTLTVLGTIDLNGRINPTFTNRIAGTLVLGDVTDSTNGGNGLTIGQSTGGYYSWLATAANGGVAKTYTGLTTFGANVIMVIDSAASLGASGNLRLNSTTLQVQPGTASVTLPAGRNFDNVAATSPVFNAPLGSTLVIAGSISGSTSGTPTKAGLGTVILRGDATAAVTTGALLVHAGTLVLDAATFGSRIWTNGVPLTLGTASGTFGNGGTLQITGSFAQSFGAVTVNPRANEIQLTGAMPLTLGAITRTTGSTLNFSVPTGTVASTTAGLSGLVNGAATWNGNDWAAANGSNISQFTSYTALTGPASAPTITSTAAANYLIDSSTTNNITLAAVGTLAAPNNANTIKHSDSAARVINLGSGFLRLGTGGAAGGGVTNAGGILVASGAGALTFSGGSLMAGGTTTNTLGDLVFINNSTSDITVNSAIVNNNGTTGTTPVVYDGRSTGKLILAGANTFTGAIIINRGVLEVATVNDTTTAGALGQGTAGAGNILLNGGTFRANLSADGATNKGFTVNAPSVIEVVANTLTLNTTVLGLATANAQHNTQNVGLLRKTGAGTLALRDLAANANNANLSIEVAEGILILNKTTTAAISAVDLPNSAALIIGDAAAGPAPAVVISGTGGNQISDASSVVVRGDQAVKGVLDLNGLSETIDGLAGSGIVTSNVAGTAVLSLGGNNSAGLAPYTLAAAAAGVNATGLNNWFGTIQDGGAGRVVALTKVGSGTQIISAAQSYSGATTISAGTLQLGVANALPSGSGKGDLTIEGGNTGTVTGSANRILALGTLDMGGHDQNINGLNSTTGGAVINNPTLAWNGSAWVAAAADNTLTFGNGDANGSFNGSLMNGITVAPGGAGATAHIGVLSLTKAGTGTQVLSGTNSYTGVTTVSAGTLQFQNQTALYNNTPAQWTANNLIVEAGAVAAFNVGGVGEFTAANIAAIQPLGSATGGFQTGSRIGLDTSNAVGVFTYGTSIADTNAGANSVGLSKLGTGALNLTAANTFTGGTQVSGGTLLLNNTLGSATGSGNVTVSAGATLAGAGIIASNNATTTVTIQGLLDVGNAADTTGSSFTVDLTGGSSVFSLGGIVQLDLWSGLGMGGGSGLAFSDLLSVNSHTIDLTGSTLKLVNSSGLGNAAFAAGDSWQLFDWNSVAFTGNFTNITSGSGNFLDLPDLDPYGLAWDTSALYTTGHIAVGIPEPSRALLLLLGLLIAGFRRRRR